MNYIRIKQALLRTVLICASVHIGTIIVLAVKSRSPEPLNVLYVLQLHELFPGITVGAGSFFVSYVILFTIFGIWYILLQQND